jgi:hypothetical protein
MRVVVLYQSNSESERLVTDFVRDYQNQTGKTIEKLDTNTRDGSNLATIYDVVRYPAVLALSNSGELQYLWMDDKLPLINEVLYYSTA